MDTQIALEDILASRVNTYYLLSRIFRIEVDDEFYGELLTLKFPKNTGNDSVDKGYELIYSYLNSPHPSVITDLAVDYTRTFIGHGNNGYSAAYPFESVYTSPKRLLMQAARDDVLVIYRAAGIDKNPSWKDGEDHIALELEFMQIMGQRALDAYRSGNEDQAAELLTTSKFFLEEHLNSWFPMMAKDMNKFSKTDFYKGVAALTLGFLDTDYEFLQDILEDENEDEIDEID